MVSEQSQNLIGSYLPVTLVDEAPRMRGVALTPHGVSIRAAALFVDITGFTTLTEKFAAEGPSGIERLTLALDQYFGQINQMIADGGGDVENIAGDAVLAFWPVPDNQTDTSKQVFLAAECARKLLQEFDDREIAPGIRLRLRAAIVSGDLVGLHVGGHQDRWNFLLAGRPLDHITDLIDNAQPGQIVAEIDSVKNEFGDFRQYSDNAAKYLGAKNPIPIEPRSRGTIDPDDIEFLKKYLPRVINQDIDAHQLDWSAELRQVTVAFVNLTGLECKTVDDVETVQQAVAIIQEIIFRYGGSLQAITMNDKGPVIMVVFGLPHQAHENDALRAVLAMRELHASLGALWLDCTCGIATGPAYCGPVGSDARRIYSVRGNVVNLAARFTAAAGYRVICDAATMQEVGDRIQFEKMPPLNLKGISDKTAVFRPRAERSKKTGLTGEFVGRENELEVILSRLDACLHGGTGGVIVLEGEAGIGKSRLIEAAVDSAKATGMRVLQGATDPFNLNTPYLTWRDPFMALLGASSETAAQDVLRRVDELLSDDSGLAGKSPLIGAVLPFPVADNPLTSQMQGSVRAENTRAILSRIITKATATTPHLLVLDDVHWMDTASWALLHHLIEESEDLVILLAARPTMETGIEDYQKLKQNSRVRVMALETLGDATVTELIKQTLGVRKIADEITQFVCQRGEGNPYYCLELALALRDANHVVIEKEECRLAKGTTSLGNIEFPNSIEKVIISRIDLLPASLQLTLKVASVIGRIFQYKILEGVYPIDDEVDELSSKLDTLQNMNLTVIAQMMPELHYSFKHIITHEVVYNLLLFSQRRELHRAVSEWIEGHWQGVLESYYPLLALHWRRAEQYEKAAYYFEKAGSNVLRSGTNRESIELFEAALEALSHVEGKRDTLRQAKIRRLLGEASIRSGALASARTYLMEALEDLGQSWPKTKFGLGLALTKQLLQQLFRQLPVTKAFFSNRTSPEATETAYVYEQLLQLFYFTNESVELVLSTSGETNWGERSSDLQLRAQSKILFGNVMGIFGLHGAARHYMELFQKTVPADVTPSDVSRNNQFSSLYLASIGDWTTAKTLLLQSLSIAEELGDSRYRREFLSLLGIVSMPKGDRQDAKKFRDLFFEAAHGADDQQTRCWAHIERGEYHLNVGELEPAIASFDDAIAFLDHVSDAEGIWAYGQMARAQWRLGNKEEALHSAEESLLRMQRTLPVGFYTFEGYMGAADVFISALEEEFEVSGWSKHELFKKASKALKGPAAFSRSFPIGLPRTLLLRARLAAVSGKKPQAIKLLRKALKEAAARNLPYDTGLIQFHLGLMATDQTERRQNLIEASEAFETLGTTYDKGAVSRHL